MLSSRFEITRTKWYDRSEDCASVRHGQTVPRSNDSRSTVSVLISSSQLIRALRRTDKKTCNMIRRPIDACGTDVFYAHGWTTFG
ncbi:hypothetical protein ARMGADRAFT_91547 [Armillaria gallica]|uniref:Uncharacterized protein n=1 Tax=Armillaria gallica TaxID=47427 RepID=A0A2H3DSE8_ARMGA|nr:hypothetical protein ARMGADRAFT_91547 [Armillaria gallica]